MRKKDAGLEHGDNVDEEEMLDMISTLERTMDGYCLKVDDTMKRAKRMVGLVNPQSPLTDQDLFCIALLATRGKYVKKACERAQGQCDNVFLVAKKTTR